MLFDELIPNMIFNGSNKFETTNTKPITLGGSVGNWVFLPKCLLRTFFVSVSIYILLGVDFLNYK